MTSLTEFLSMLLPEMLQPTQLAVHGLCNTYERLTSSEYVKTIDKNTSKHIFRREYGQDLDECAICVSEYLKGEEVRELKCKHAFHRDCIDKWLHVHDLPKCPLCRRLVLPEKIAVEHLRVRSEHQYGYADQDVEQMVNAIASALIGSEN